MARRIRKKKDDFTTETGLVEFAIILDFLIAALITADRPTERVTARCINNRIILTGWPETVLRLNPCINSLVKALIEADYLRYSNEVATHLIFQKYLKKQSRYGYQDLLDDYSYAPEIQKFIRLTAAHLQKASDRESEV